MSGSTAIVHSVGFDQSERFRTCPWCGLHDAQMNLHGQYELATLKQRVRYWTLLSCPRCAGPILIETSAPNTIDAVGQVVPDEGAEVQIDHLPEDVEEYYSGAIRVLEAGVPDAAAVQLRRALEAAAAHCGVDSGPLVKRIEKLIDNGLITRGFGDVLDHIREVGNVGAHASDEKVDETTARRALRFTTQVLRNLFEIPAELKNLDANDEPEPEADQA